jgi:hypothetical protein
LKRGIIEGTAEPTHFEKREGSLENDNFEILNNEFLNKF